MKLAANAGNILLTSLIIFVALGSGCQPSYIEAPGNLPETGALPSEQHTVAYTVFKDGQHRIVVQEGEHTSREFDAGRRPITLFANHGRPNSVIYWGQGGLSALDGTIRSQLLPPPVLPRFSAITLTASHLWLFDERLMEVSKVSLADASVELVLGADRIADATGRKRLIQGQMLLPGLSVSPSGSRLALSLPGDEAVYERSRDWSSIVHLIDLQGAKAIKLGKGTPVAWVDENTLLVWSIEWGKERGPDLQKYVVRIYTTDGTMLEEQENVGSVAWNGHDIYLIRVDEGDGYSRLIDAPTVEVWTRDLKSLRSRFKVQAPFSHDYNKNFVALGPTDGWSE